MKNQNKFISQINLILRTVKNEELLKMLPIAIEDLVNNPSLCEFLIDYLGDIYVCSGLDEQYNETLYGSLIYELICFLASINDQSKQS